MDESKKDGAEERGVDLEWRDVVALVIASLQSILLPFVVIILVLIALVMVVTWLF